MYSDDASKLESTLFSILQFIFSLGFGWIITKITSTTEFYESQKRFALSAYRRIKEIEKAVERLIQRTNSGLTSLAVENNNNSLEAVNLMAIHIRETIRSSIADWADIIGEEIETVDEIEKKEDELQKMYQEKTNSSDELLEKISKDIANLKSSLPSELKMVTRAKLSFDDQVKENIKRLKEQTPDDGIVEFSGFTMQKFGCSLDDIIIDNIYDVCIDDFAGRTSVFVLKNEKGKSVGVLTNSLGYSYPAFQTAIIESIGKSRFKVVVTESVKKDNLLNAHHFKARLIKCE